MHNPPILVDQEEVWSAASMPLVFGGVGLRSENTSLLVELGRLPFCDLEPSSRSWLLNSKSRAHHSCQQPRGQPEPSQERLIPSWQAAAHGARPLLRDP